MATTETTAASPVVAAQPVAATRYNRSLLGDTWRRFRRHKLAVLGAIVYLSLVVITMIGPAVWKTPINDLDFGYSFTTSNPFSAAHPLGADDLGRDTLARVLWGGRVSIAVGLAAMARPDVSLPQGLQSHQWSGDTRPAALKAKT